MWKGHDEDLKRDSKSIEVNYNPLCFYLSMIAYRVPDPVGSPDGFSCISHSFISALGLDTVGLCLFFVHPIF